MLRESKHAGPSISEILSQDQEEEGIQDSEKSNSKEDAHDNMAHAHK